MNEQGRPVPGDILGRAAWIDELCDRFEAACLKGQRPEVPAFLHAAGIDADHSDSRLLWELERLAAAYPASTPADIPAPNAVTVNTEASPTPSAPAPLPMIPGYDMLAELGRGGMGVVYHARHQMLNRPVAIKMLLGGRYHDPVARMRFTIEAEAVAALNHPQIVQLHEFGTFEEQPYFALEYVAGGTLASKLTKGGPFPPQQAAELVETLANAVAAAHAKGIVHRDLKPGNILLTEQGEPKIADFGLARIGQSDLTLTGAILGTPSYMSPEQASGRRSEIGTASDIYALGAILYELLTGQPPFKGPTMLATLQLVQTQTPTRPKSLNAALPLDLETICLKCLAKTPAERYETAQSLAADLHAFRVGQPIAARPVGWLERGRKWVYRNPLVSTSLLAVVVAVVGGTATSVGFGLHAQASAVQARSDKHKAEQGETAARTAQRNAEESLAMKIIMEQRTRVALDTMTTSVVDELLEKQPALSISQQDYLKTCQRLYEEYAADATPTLANRLLAADAQRRVGSIRMRLGAKDAADAFAKARTQLVALLHEYPDDLNVLRVYAQTLAEGAMVARIAGEFATASRDAVEALARMMQLVARTPQWEYRLLLARTAQRTGVILEAGNQLADAERVGQTAVTEFTTLHQQRPHEPIITVEYAGSLLTQGIYQQQRQRPAEAEQSFRTALRLFAGFTSTGLTEHNRQSGLARCQLSLGALLLQRGPSEECERLLQASRRSLETLLATFANVAQHRVDYGTCLLDLCQCHTQRGEANKALPLARLAREVFRQLVQDFGTPDVRLLAARTCQCLGELLAQQVPPPDEVEPLFREGLTQTEALVKQFPNVAVYQHNLAVNQQALARWCFQQKRHADAEKLFREALVTWGDEATLRDASDARLMRALGQTQYALLLIQLNRLEQAETLLREAEKVLQPFHDTRLDVAYDLAQVRSAMAGVAMRNGQFKEATTFLQDAAPLLEKYIAQRGQNVDTQRELLADTYCTLGQIAAIPHRQPKDSLAWFAKALAVLEKLTPERQQTGNGRQYLLNTLEGRAGAYTQLERHPEAVRDYEQACEKFGPTTSPMLRQRRALATVRAGFVSDAFKQAETLANLPANPPGLQLELARIFALIETHPRATAEEKTSAAKRADTLLDGLHKSGVFDDPRVTTMFKADRDFATARPRWEKRRAEEAKKP